MGRTAIQQKELNMLRCNRYKKVFTASLFVAAAIPVPAIEPADVLIYSKEPFSARPRFDLTETYNDNIFSRPNGADDFITTISPGLNLRVGRPERNSLSFDYRFSHHFYVDRDDLDSDEHSFELRSRLQGERLVLTGNDRIQLLSSPIGLVEVIGPGRQATPPISGGRDPQTGQPTAPTPTPGPVVPGDQPTSPIRGGEVIATVEERNVDRTTFYDAYNLGYVISEKTSVYLQGVHTTTDYESGIRLFDITTLRGTAGFGYQAFPKTGFFGEVYYGQTSIDPNFPSPGPPHVNFIGGFLGARGNFTEKLTGAVKVGYESREFSDDTSAPSSPVVDLSLAHRLSEKTSIQLNFARLHDVSIQFERESYTANVARLSLSQALGTSGKWRASIGGSYGLFEYDTTSGSPDREYNIYSAYFALIYQIQDWLGANFSYNFDTIKSDSGGVAEYDVNRVSLGVSVGY